MAFIEKHLMGLTGGGTKHNPYWTSWPREAVNSEHTYQLVKRYMHRPAEELYDTANDPYEMTNLAEDRAHVGIKLALAKQLDAWTQSQGDPGVPLDSQQSLRAARNCEHPHAPPAPK